MQTKNLHLIFLFMILFGLIFGCTPEEEQIINETETIQNDPKNSFKESFTLKNFKEIDGILNGGLDVDWSSSTEKLMKNGRKLYEFKATPSTPTSLDSDVQLPNQFFVLGEQDESGNTTTWVVKIKPDITAAPIDYSYINLKDYSGSIVHYDLEGNILRMEGWQKGKGISLVENADEPQPNIPDSMAATCQQRSSLANFGLADPFDPCPGGGGGSWVPIHTDHYTEWFLVRENGVLEATGNIDYNGRTTEYIWVSNGGSSGFYQSRYNYYKYYLSNGSSQQLNSKPNLVIPFKLINKLTGKANCVFGNLVLANGNLFGETIGAFIDDPEYDLTIQVGNCTSTDDACTNGTDPNSIVITIEDVNQSSLGIAALILHEGLHAEMHRYVSRFESGVDPNNRARLLQLYAYYKGWGNTNNNPNYVFTNDAHHVYMVENYVEAIASAIRTLDGNRYPLANYMAYGWEGLEDSGYLTQRLSQSQNTTNQNLRSIVESSFTEFCN